jgi:hypothetical protein
MKIALQIPRILVLHGFDTKPNLIHYKLHGLSLSPWNTVKFRQWGKISAVLNVN